MKHSYFGSPKHVALCVKNGQAKRLVRDLAWFMRFVHKTETCWEWTGVLRLGYGFFQIVRTVKKVSKVTNWKAHRYSWVLNFGPIPKNLFVCHHCDNKKCVRPDHLFLGTLNDNVQDAKKKGLIARGENQSRATISNATAIEIKRKLREGLRIVDIATELHLKVHTVENIKYGNSFAWLD